MKTRTSAAFNADVAKLHRLYQEQTPAGSRSGRVEFESYFNRIQPMTLAISLYVTAFVIAALGWLALAFDWTDGAADRRPHGVRLDGLHADHPHGWPSSGGCTFPAGRR